MSDQSEQSTFDRPGPSSAHRSPPSVTLLGAPSIGAAAPRDREMAAADPAPQQDELLSKSVAELSAMMRSGAVSSHDLTQRYLARIAQMSNT